MEAPYLPCLSGLNITGLLKLFLLVLQVSAQVPLPLGSPLGLLGFVWSHPDPLTPCGSTRSLAPQFTRPSLCAPGSPVPLHCEFLDQRPLQILPCACAKREARHAVGSNHFRRGWGICWGICYADHISPGALGDRKRLLLSLRAKIHFFRSHIPSWRGGFVDYPHSGGQGWGQGDLGYKERE